MLRIRKKISGKIFSALLLFAFAETAYTQWNPLNPVLSVQKDRDGVLLTMKSGMLKLDVCTDAMVRVLYSPTSSIPRSTEYLIVKSNWPRTEWAMHSTGDTVTLVTPRLKVFVTRNDGAITFLDQTGKKLFTQNSCSMTSVVVNGEKTYHAEIFSNLWGSYECFYGLGGHQSGVWNYRGEAVDISHDNTNIGIPFFTSSNGYGIFWNNTSRSRFNNRFLNALYLSSDVADIIDYFFIYGPEPDTIIAGYRELTGGVPMFPQWAYGFWQCKNRYASQGELLEVSRKYRTLHIPIDGIVQDWFWWYTMGEPIFDASRYPHPKEMVGELHKDNFHLMISFWPYFRPGTKTYEDMDRKKFFVDRTKVSGFHPAGQALYDAFNPDARKYYWKLIDTSLFKIGIDAWWLDTVEPETEGSETNVLVNNRVAIGNGARYANMYPLMTETGVYEGQRATSEKKRVFILARSAYAGSQRNAVTVWSGDINSDWIFFKKQIPSGLNYCISGLPYWTTDIGGFLLGDPNDPGYRELFVRWFQFGTFNPIFRVHGTRTTNQNELWSYGSEAQTILVKFDRLRYRLLPYIYSLAWMTTNKNYTIMRPLAMEFRTDVRAANVGDQFMFGPAFLVNPVTEPASETRSLYLPKAQWYDFWTGRMIDGGQRITAEAPLERLPIYVRSGSIVPLGPNVEWTGQVPADTIELRIYKGADGEFSLYEDEGDNYNYEKGIYSVIPFHWDEMKQELTIEDRVGQFPGMVESRTLRIIFVGDGHGIGVDPADRQDALVTYSGKKMIIPR